MSVAMYSHDPKFCRLYGMLKQKLREKFDTVSGLSEAGKETGLLPPTAQERLHAP